MQPLCYLLNFKDEHRFLNNGSHGNTMSVLFKQITDKKDSFSLTQQCAKTNFCFILTIFLDVICILPDRKLLDKYIIISNLSQLFALMLLLLVFFFFKLYS